jgi:hypothetical protein
MQAAGYTCTCRIYTFCRRVSLPTGSPVSERLRDFYSPGPGAPLICITFLVATT